ncbi:MAG TPA: prepilin-type N-terminal cleavage/methylation domain-containing protein [Fimbriimonadaceae bacterium]|nr:prepilin-type N-terminal cleavage/methylation domain-containing protein [Fimbriimonadaceae bacterium]
MRRSTQAYTLIELLAVIAIVALLASLLMPVFVSAKDSAKQNVCFSHFKQTGTATGMYVADYDSYYMPISYRPGQLGTSRNDRTWVQLLLPYAPSFSVFLCPSDTSRKPNLDATFDEDLVPGDLYSAYYGASKRTNMGYNYMTLSPVVRDNRDWRPAPRRDDFIKETAATLLFIDSVNEVDPNGQPFGGGNWLVVPPCRYMTIDGKPVDLLKVDTFSFKDIFAVTDGWGMNSFGHAWPWHFKHVNVAFADTHARALTTAQLAAGCDVMPNWGGETTALDESPWFAGH